MVYIRPRICLGEWVTLTFFDFDIQTDHLISARQPDLIIINRKREIWILLSQLTTELKESEKKDRYHDIARELKIPWNMKVAGIPIVIDAVGTVTISKRSREHKNKRTSGDHPNYNIFEIGQNTEKSPGVLRKLVVTQTPVTDHQLTLRWKLSRSKMIIVIIISEIRGQVETTLTVKLLQHY